MDARQLLGFGRGASTATAAATGAALDTRLIALVQERAGARVHEAANLLQVYWSWAHLLAQTAAKGDAGEANEAGRNVRAAVAALRRFLLKLSAQPRGAASTADL